VQLHEIYTLVDKISPFELQEKWDNSGLIVGDKNQEITNIVLSLDIDEALLESVEEGSLIITHHPLIFSGIKSMDYASYPSNLLYKMIEKKIANIAMHTNFDKTHLNAYVAQKVLGYKISEVDDFLIYFDVNEKFETFYKKIQKAFHLEELRCVQCHDEVQRVALCTGSGASLLRDVKADCFLTGDIKYHEAMEAKSINLSMIDINHYESEVHFAEILATYLEIKDITVIISQSENPFTYFTS